MGYVPLNEGQKKDYNDIKKNNKTFKFIQENKKFKDAKIRYEKYKSATNYEDFIKLGGNNKDLRNDLQKGYIILDEIDEILSDNNSEHSITSEIVDIGEIKTEEDILKDFMKDLINKVEYPIDIKQVLNNYNKDNKLIEKYFGEKKNIEYNFIEVCAGGGGLSSGLIKSGFKPLLLNDIDNNSCNTLKINHPDTEIHKGTFTDINYDKYINKCDLLCGGVPCQSFSYAGKQKGLDDKRGDLILKFSEMINIIKPKIFMIENVKGLLTHNNGETLKYIINNCLNKNNNYNIKYKLIKCVYHNIPQKRERLIIIGILKKYNFIFNFPVENNNNILTVRDALMNVPKSDGAKYSESKINYFKKIPPGGCWINLSIDEQKEYMGAGYYSGGGKRGVLRKLSWDEPCLTILCSPGQKNTERCHPSENRPLTIRESARIQTFSDEYKFCGSINSQYSQIGNAVPVKLGEILGIELIKSLNIITNNIS